MSEHRASILWTRSTEDFRYESYNREHTWSFEGGVQVPASAAPEFLGAADAVDPEEAFVASLSSCHMLTFLAIAARKRHTVESYRDAAVGFMEKNEKGRLAITRVELRPQIEFGGERKPGFEQIERMHELAHEQCFIANSVRTHVRILNPDLQEND